MAKELQKAIEAWAIHMESRPVPSCFTEKEYKAWLIHEHDAPTQPIRQFGCRDCTSAYQKEMTAQGKCVNPKLNLGRYGN
jgi:hypothetical protein